MKKLKQAVKLAKDYIRTEPDIKKVYWFPNEKETRIVITKENIATAASGRVEPYYFNDTSAVSFIRPEEYQQIDLPDDWGNWNDAKELETT